MTGALDGGIDPSTSFSNDSAVTSNVYETLVKYQVGADGVGKLVPSLAEKWESSADGKQWTFHLRQALLCKLHVGFSLVALARERRQPGFVGSSVQCDVRVLDV